VSESAAPKALTIEILVERVVAAQRAAGESIDPNGARKLIRALVALGLLQVA
jgi:hypothetical protein